MEQERNVGPRREQARELPNEEKPLEPAQRTRDEQKTSAKKIEANRRNALKSTGPKTAAGKKVVAQNATKYGFFSKGLLIRHPFGNESQKEYDDCYGRIRQHFQPEGFAEECWVEKIAVYLWRLRRVMRFESGQIALNMIENQDTLQKQDSEKSNASGPRPPRDSEPESRTDHLCLPPRDLAELILRYEPMLNRQLNLAFAELERLQRHRKGEPVPAPLRVEVSGTS